MTTETQLSNMPGHLIRRLNQHSTAVFQHRLRAEGYDVTPVQYSALETLSHAPGLDQATLAARIAYDRATIGNVVKRLEQKALILRQPNEKDRRAFRLWLTPSGNALLAQVRPVVSSLQDDILAGLTDHEAGTLIRLMRKALGVDENTPPAG